MRRRSNYSAARYRAYSGYVRPAGQETTPDITFTPDEAATYGTGNTVTPTPETTTTGGTTYAPMDNPSQDIADTDIHGNPINNTLTGLTTQQQTLLFGTVGNALGTTGTAVSSIVHSNDQVQMAQLSGQVQTAISSLYVEEQTANTAGNSTAAAAAASQIAALQQFQSMISPGIPVAIWYALGGMGVLLVGATAYIFLSGRKKKKKR